MKLLLQLLLSLHAIQLGAAIDQLDLWGQSEENSVEDDDGQTYNPTVAPTIEDTTYKPTTLPTPKPTPLLITSESPTASDTYSPTEAPSIEDTTYKPTTLPTPKPTPLLITSDSPTASDTYSPTEAPTMFDNDMNSPAISNFDLTETTSDLGKPETVIVSAAQSQSETSKSNGQRLAIAAGIVVSMIILVALGFGVYRKKRADDREVDACPTLSEQQDSETKSADDDNTPDKLHDVELV
jgi:hypothetical protein